MSYDRFGGVQSTPRVMRGAPVARGSYVDVPLEERGLSGTFDGMSNTTMALAAIGAVGLIYYLGKGK